jgi:hypothetical protein
VGVRLKCIYHFTVFISSACLPPLVPQLLCNRCRLRECYCVSISSVHASIVSASCAIGSLVFFMCLFAAHFSLAEVVMRIECFFFPLDAMTQFVLVFTCAFGITLC